MGKYRVDNRPIDNELGVLVKQGVIDLERGPKVPVHRVRL